MKKNLVMVVDDEKMFADSLADLLRRNGYEAITAYSAADAFKALDKNKAVLGLGSNRIKCILLDIKMPEMDGLQFLDKLREEYKERIGVIMVTAYEDDEKWLEVASGYVAGYVKKPINEELVITMLNRFFSGKEEEMAQETMEDYLAGEEKRKQFRKE